MGKILGYELGVITYGDDQEFTNLRMSVKTLRFRGKKIDLRAPVALITPHLEGEVVHFELKKRKITLFFNCGIKVRKKNNSVIEIEIDDEQLLELHANLQSLIISGEVIKFSGRKTFQHTRTSALDVSFLQLELKEKEVSIPFYYKIQFDFMQAVKEKKTFEFPNPEGYAYNYLEAYQLQEMGVIALHPETLKPWPIITLTSKQAEKLEKDRLAQLQAQWQQDCQCKD